MDFFNKMKGGGKPHPIPALSGIFWSWIGSAVGIGLCGWVTSQFLEGRDLTLMLGSFGATAVLVYGAIHSPLAQPRNCLVGHILSAVIGVFFYKLLGGIPWLAASLAVSISIVVMTLTNTLHPPGGATALIAVIGSNKITDLGYFYAVMPVAIGALLLIIVALIVNNIAPSRKYPIFW